MPEEALQAAFEIKTACDEISRRLLRWHWEHKPGSNSLGALLDHIAQRQQESPDYYDRMPDLSGKSSWQQLDTTICMRVLLDPEKDAEKPLDLLGNTSSPGAARPDRRGAGGDPVQRSHRMSGGCLCGHGFPGKRAGPLLPSGRGVFVPLRGKGACCIQPCTG